MWHLFNRLHTHGNMFWVTCSLGTRIMLQSQAREKLAGPRTGPQSGQARGQCVWDTWRDRLWGWKERLLSGCLGKARCLGGIKSSFLCPLHGGFKMTAIHPWVSCCYSRHIFSNTSGSKRMSNSTEVSFPGNWNWLLYALTWVVVDGSSLKMYYGLFCFLE